MQNLFRLFMLVILGQSFAHAQQQADFQFYFGTAISSQKGTSISTQLPYNFNTGFGFDFGTAYRPVFNSSGFSTAAPVYFSVKLTEGRYLVEVTLGNENQSSETTIKAESKRLFVDQKAVSAGEVVQVSFTADVHTPQISENKRMVLKDRELTILNFDDKLTLEFTGNSAVQSIAIKPVTDVTTVFLAGDSTVTDQDVEPWASWGQFITAYFDESVAIANYAYSGSSLASFKGSNRLEKITSQLKKGDYVMIEFGHNDEKIKGEGNGPWEYYYNTLVDFITQVKEKGGIPVLITPTQRRAFEGDKLVETHGDYPAAMRKAAKDEQVALIDVTAMTTKMFEAWGAEGSRKAFVQYPANMFPGQTQKLEDNTHFNDFGANEIALAVLQGLRKTNLKLKDHIKVEAPQYNPSQPNRIENWSLPYSDRFELAKPDGN